MACSPSLCSINVAPLARRRWANPSFLLFMDRYAHSDLHTSFKNYSDRSIRSAKMVNLLKSFEEKRVILKKRIHGVKISLVYALKCHSLPHSLQILSKCRRISLEDHLTCIFFAFKFHVFLLFLFHFFDPESVIHVNFLLQTCCSFWLPDFHLTFLKSDEDRMFYF